MFTAFTFLQILTENFNFLKVTVIFLLLKQQLLDCNTLLWPEGGDDPLFAATLKQ